LFGLTPEDFLVVCKHPPNHAEAVFAAGRCVGHPRCSLAARDHGAGSREDRDHHGYHHGGGYHAHRGLYKFRSGLSSLEDCRQGHEPAIALRAQVPIRGDAWQAEMKVKKQAHFVAELVGVPDSAKLQATVYMKQKYKWQSLGYSKCGRKSAMITFPHDLSVHIEPFQKDSSARFYQYISLTFQKHVTAWR
ncbi:unnamed protein product, partial [Effrenium voratum]